MTFEYFLAIESNQRTKPSWQRMNKQTNIFVCSTFWQLLMLTLPIQTYTCTKQYHYLIKDFIDRDVWLASLLGSWFASCTLFSLTVKFLQTAKLSSCAICSEIRLNSGLGCIIVPNLSWTPEIWSLHERIKYSAKGLTKTIILVGWTVPWNLVVEESVVLEDRSQPLNVEMYMKKSN